MPEYPDIQVYLESIERRVGQSRLDSARVIDPFVLRTARPPIGALEGRRAAGYRRLGKRVVIGFEGDLWLVIHLMVAGRLHWSEPKGKPTARNALAHFRFETGVLTLTEAGSKHRASIHVLEGESALGAHDPGGIDCFSATPEAFAAALTRGNHTLKRALTDPQAFSGIGNAYSDEILHAARLSPVSLTQSLGRDEIERLRLAVTRILTQWAERLRREAADRFPEKVTAFRPEMAVHGKFGQPCPDCGTAVQRIRYVENEVNYCPRCQTGGKLLADRSLSRLLKSDWPRSIDEAETKGMVFRPNG